jgi:hypothetical protein
LRWRRRDPKSARAAGSPQRIMSGCQHVMQYGQASHLRRLPTSSLHRPQTGINQE